MTGKGVLLSEIIIFLVSLVLLSLIDGSESRHAVRRRSHQHMNVCRKEFLRPLEKRIADVDLVFTGIVERIYQYVDSSSSDDLSGSGAGERRRREHQVSTHVHHRRHHRPNARSHHHRRSHRQHDVRSFSHSDPNWITIPGSGGSVGSSSSGNAVSVVHYRGIVRVKRVIKGDKRFQGNRVIVEGFGSDKFCISDAKERDTRIFFANPILNGRLRIHYSLMHYNLENLRKVHLAAKAALSETLDEEPSAQVLRTSATSTSTTTVTTTSSTTPVPVLQSSQSLIPDPGDDKKAVGTLLTAENEIESSGGKDEGAKRKRKKRKNSKGKSRRNRKKHLVSSSSTTTTAGPAIDSSSSTLSIIESSVLT